MPCSARLLGAAAALLLAVNLPAQEARKTPPLTFTGDIAFVDASGNSEVTTINVLEQITYRTGRLTLEQTFGATHGRTEGETTASLVRGGLRGDYHFQPRLGAYLQLNVERNRFAGIDRRFEQGTGVTYDVVALSRDSVRFEGGASFVQQRSPGGQWSDFPSARTAARYVHRFAERTHFRQLVELLPNLRDTGELRVNSETTVIAPISTAIGLRLGYALRYDSRPPVVGVEKLDRVFSAGIQITLQ
jgi:putative salt-induced outer membrane protein YdiY